MLLATITVALGQDKDASAPELIIKDTVPPGFENLMQERNLFVEVRFNDRGIGTFEILADAETIQFQNPQRVVESLDNIHKQNLIVEALSKSFPTNAHLICFARNEPVGCGLVDPLPVAVIFDENLLTLDLFLAQEFQLIQNAAIEQYLPAAEKRGSSILAMDAVASDGFRQSSLDLTARSRSSYGAGHIYAEAEYNTRTDATRVRSLQLTHLFRKHELTMGTFSFDTGSLLNNTAIIGASLKTSFSTRINLDEAFSSELVIFLTRRSLVQIIIDDRVYLAKRYAAGNQTLDTGALPRGTYEVEIRITDAVSGERSEFRLFTKSTQIPPRDETLVNFTAGSPVKFEDGVFPERQNLSMGGFSISRRLSDRSSWKVGVLGVGPLAMAEAQYLLLGEHVSLQAGVGAGTNSISSGTLRLGVKHNNTSSGINARWFTAAPSTYEQENLKQVLPRDVIQLGANISHAFDKTSLSARVNERITSENSGLQLRSRRTTLSLRHALTHRTTWRASLQASYTQSEDGYRVTVGINGSWVKPRSSASVLVESTLDDDNQNFLRQSLTYRKQSAIGAPSSWSAQLRAGTDTNGEIFGISSTLENELASASFSNDWTKRQNNEIERTSTAKLGTRIAIDSKGLALGGSRSGRSGMILDVSGEPRGAEYDIVVNGVKRGTGKVDVKRFIGLSPLQEYAVQLLPKASLTSSLNTTSFKFTAYPGSVKRLQANATIKVLLIASIVTVDGDIIDDGYIVYDENPLIIGSSGILQIEATPGELLLIQRDNAPNCKIRVPEAKDGSDVSIPTDPLVCKQ